MWEMNDTFYVSAIVHVYSTVLRCSYTTTNSTRNGNSWNLHLLKRPTWCRSITHRLIHILENHSKQSPLMCHTHLLLYYTGPQPELSLQPLNYTSPTQNSPPTGYTTSHLSVSTGQFCSAPEFATEFFIWCLNYLDLLYTVRVPMLSLGYRVISVALLWIQDSSPPTDKSNSSDQDSSNKANRTDSSSSDEEGRAGVDKFSMYQVTKITQLRVSTTQLCATIGGRGEGLQGRG